MNCPQTVTVNVEAVNWLKEKYPALCIKAGLCERIGGRLYTKTYYHPSQRKQEPAAWGMENDDGQIYDCITPEEHARQEGQYTVALYRGPQPNVTTSDMKQEHVDKTAKQRHEENT